MSTTVEGLSPTPPAEPFHSGPFLRLIPHNYSAKLAFHDVAAAMLDNKYSYQHQFTHINEEQEPAPRRGTGRPSMSPSENASERTSSPASSHGDAPTQVWTGYYTLSLQNTPESSGLSWRFGCGRWKSGRKELRQPLGEVELLLTRDAHGSDIRGMHGYFYFNTDTGMMMLSSQHSAPDGISLDNDTFAKSHRALNSNIAQMILGKHAYQISYAHKPGTLPEENFQAQKTQFFRNELRASTPLPALSATPGELHHTVGGWVLHENVGKGGFGLVTAASNKMGKAVAVKTLIRDNQQSAHNIAQEVQAARDLQRLLQPRDHMERVIRMLDTLYQYGSPHYTVGKIETVWILYSPLARGTFASDILKELEPRRPTETAILILFRQVLEGLSFLHDLNWLHRDVKPQNIGILCLHPPKAVILDIGCARILPTAGGKFPPTPGRIGTIGYLAPEMEWESYDQAVDIWAAGIMGHEIILKKHPWPMSINPWRDRSHPKFRPHVRDYNKKMQDLHRAGRDDPTKALIAIMLNLDPAKRPSAKEAMSHPCFAYIMDEWESPGVETSQTGEKRHRA